MANETIDTSQISVDDEGNVVIKNPVLAAAVRSMLTSQVAAQRLKSGQEPGTNISSCGNNC